MYKHNYKLLKLITIVFLFLSFFVISNVHALDDSDTITISGTITWADDNNHDRKRPETVILNLIADGDPAVDDDGNPINLTIATTSNTSYSFEDVPKYKDDQEIVYAVIQDEIEAYETTYEGFQITNTHDNETVTIKGKVIWNDYDNEDGVRPESVVINLWQDYTNVYIDKLTVTAETDWEYEFTDLLKYNGYGREYRYGVGQSYIPKYMYYSEGLDVIDTQINRTKNIKIKKVDEEGKPIPNAKFDIYETMTFGSMWYNSPRNAYDIDPNTDWNNPGKYSIFPRGGFTFGYFISCRISPTKARSFQRYPLLADMGFIPEYCIYTEKLLFKDGTTLLEFLDEYGRFPYDDEYTFDDIDYENTVWHAIETTEIFHVCQTFPGGYHFSVEDDLSDISFKVVDWKDLDNDVLKIANGILDGCVDEYYTDYPEEMILKVRKLIDDRYLGEIELDGNPTAETNDTYSKHKIGEFTTDENGEIHIDDLYYSYKVALYRYSSGYYVIEALNPNMYIVESQTGNDMYQLDTTEYNLNIREQDEITIVNKYKTIEITCEKIWDDDNDSLNKRPDSIDIELLADGEIINKVQLTNKDDWRYTFNGLPKYKNNKEIEYSINELTVDGYETEIDGYTITNTLKPEKEEKKEEEKIDENKYYIPKTGIE